MPATATGAFIASRRNGSPSSWLIIASISVVLPTPLPPAPTPGRATGYPFQDNGAELKTAVRERFADPVAAEAKYGTIDTWDVSNVKDMRSAKASSAAYGSASKTMRGNC